MASEEVEEALRLERVAQGDLIVAQTNELGEDLTAVARAHLAYPDPILRQIAVLCTEMALERALAVLRGEQEQPGRDGAPHPEG